MRSANEKIMFAVVSSCVTSPLIEVGDYTYYDDPDHPTEFETRNVLYNFGPDRLVIGRFWLEVLAVPPCQQRTSRMTAVPVFVASRDGACGNGSPGGARGA